MKTNAKRLLSMVICLLMVITMLPVAAFAASTTLVYCQAPDNWKACNAYWWDSATASNPQWPGVAMTQNEDGIWYIEVPSDAVGLIFNDGNGTQTSDLTVPKDNKVMYVFGNGTWATYGKVEVKTFDYYVAGEAALCGDNWSPSSPSNGMTDQDGDGIYTITYYNVAAGSYELKVTDGSWANSWGANGGSTNYVLILSEDTDALELRFDSVTHRISTSGEKPFVPVYYVAGNMNEWQAAAEGYQMTKKGDDYVLQLVLKSGDYEIKVTDGTWANSWGDGEGNYCFTVLYKCQVTVTFNADGSTITVTGEGVGTEEKKPLEIQSVHVVGEEGLTGSDWNPAANPMKELNDVYTITFENVAAGTYEFKFAANGTWDLSWGYGSDMEAELIYDAWVNGGNNKLTIFEGNATVTITLDLTTIDMFTGEGAKCSVAVSVQKTELIEEGTATFQNADAAADGHAVVFTPATNGVVTVEILSCRPGFFIDVYSGGEWLVDFDGKQAQTVAFDVTGGNEVELLICSYSIYSDFVKEAAAGTVTYKVTFTSDGGDSDDEAPELPDDVFNEPGSSMNNPKIITSYDWTFLPGNTTVWYLFDNYQNMVENEVYSMMLRIHSEVSYSVVYDGNELDVDADGFVNYRMEDENQRGQYLFCVTNHSAADAFFSINVEDVPDYVNNGGVLAVGDNKITLDSSAENTLYEFIPGRTGIYRITVSSGLVGEWGSAFNPSDNTPEKSNTLEWTCTDPSQSVMIGFTGTKTALAVVTRIGNYVPTEEIPYEIYENTYDFSYVMPTRPVTVDIDLLDGGVHTAVLGADGFYHIGTSCGPLIVTDLSKIEIDVEDAYVNGGLRVWFVDDDGVTVSKTDYNEAMNEYLQAGLVPVTEELATMLSELGMNKDWWVANGVVFGEEVPKDLYMAWMQLCAYLEGSSAHTYEYGVCTGCGAEDPNYVKEYYLFGNINGADYGCEADYENMGEYKFVKGTLVATFTEDSYVAVKTGGNRAWYMTDGWMGKVTSAKLYDTDKVPVEADKLFVPGHVELTFTLTENGDGTLTLSYQITACDHNYSEKVTVQPGCENRGERTFTCSYCGDSYTQSVEATGHSYTEKITVQPGCETKGKKTFTCKNCGDSYTQSIPSLGGHSYSEKITVQPGCETKGEKTFTCKNCGDSYTQSIPSLGGHSYKQSATVEPECEVDGLKIFTCENCDDSYSQSIPAIGHSYKEKITVQPGCETKGEKLFTCENCGNSYTKEIPALGGHSYTEKITVQPGCETQGKKLFTCSKCGDSYTESVPSLGGHSYTESITVQPGCETEGEKTFTCTACDDSYTETIPSLGGHSYQGGQCTVCGGADPDYVKNYYLFGYINGANYGCEEDYENMGEYRFVNGQLTATFTQDSYVAVKTEGNGAWYMTKGWLGMDITSATLYDTAKETMEANKLFVPAYVEITFTLVENEDGTLTLSYEKAARYRVSFVVPEGVPAVEDMICGTQGAMLPVAGTPVGAHSYVFVGWVDAKTADTTVAPNIYNGAFIPTEDTTLYALYSYTEGGSSEGGWKLVTDASTLTAGDTLILGSSGHGKVASELNKQILTAVDAVFSEDGTTVTLPEGAQLLTLGQKNGAWTLLNGEGKALGCTSAKKLAWGDGTVTWTITVDETGAATVASTEGTLGRILYNVSNPRFTTYTSNVTSAMLLPQLYKLAGEVGTTYYTTEITPVPEEPEGYTVSGSITSSAIVEGDVTVELWLEGADAAAYTTVSSSGVYTIENVIPGTYTLTVSKVNHVTRRYTITVESEAVTQSVKLQLLGDVTGDGQINIGDVAKVYAHIKGTTPITDEYLMDCANGNGGVLNIGDVASIYAHVKGTRPFF